MESYAYDSYAYDSIPLLALVAAVIVALVAHPARTSRLAMTSAPVAILAALGKKLPSVNLAAKYELGTKLVETKKIGKIKSSTCGK
jgi:hypothetical protein